MFSTKPIIKKERDNVCKIKMKRDSSGNIVSREIIGCTREQLRALKEMPEEESEDGEY